MTIEEMHNQVLLRLNKVGAYRNRDFIPAEIDVYLNNSILKYVKEQIKPHHPKMGLESSPKSLANLSTLIVKKNVTAYYDESFIGYETDYLSYPDDYLYVISVGGIDLNEGSITTITVDGKTKRNVTFPSNTYKVNTKFIPMDDIYSILDDPFNQPSTKQLIYNEFAKGVIIYTPNNCVVDTGVITYIKQPTTVVYDDVDGSTSVDCELPDHTHDAIVAMTVETMLSDTDSLGPQQRLINLTENE